MIRDRVLSDGSIVYVVDDDRSVRLAIEGLLKSAGIGVKSYGSAREFFDRPAALVPACLVLDTRLPDTTGLDVQRELTEQEPTLSVIFITGHGDISMSVRAMKA